MKARILKYIGISLLCLSHSLTGQIDVDSLIDELDNELNDTARIELLIKISGELSWLDVDRSEEYARQALRSSQEINYLRGLAYSNYNLSKVYADYEFDLSEKLILETLKYARLLNDSLLIGKVYNIIGHLKSNADLIDDTKHYYLSSLKIFINHGSDSLAAAIYNNLGIYFASIDLHDSALIYYQKAAEINEKYNNLLWLAINHLNMGNDLLDRGELEKAFSQLEYSLELAEANDYNRLYPWIYNNFSKYYFIVKDYDKSIEMATIAIDLAKGSSNRLQERYGLEYLKDAYYETGNIAEAYKYLEEIQVLNDSINKHNRLKEIDLLEMRINFEAETKQLELDKAIREAEHARKEVMYLLILALVGLVLISFILLYTMQHNKIRRKSLEQKFVLLEKDKLASELEYKNKELTTNVIYLLRKNEFISNISEKLKSADLNNEQEQKDFLDKITNELDKSVAEDSWEEFERRFQEVHVGFNNKLIASFPDLTANELRLCAFLRLNLSNHDISEITFQSLDSLKTARYRLRKKLNLSREDNLVNFLAKF